MKIERVSFRNFGSYGNKLLTLEIPPEASLALIFGANGGGKSTLSDIIKFAIYGKVDNKKLKDLANRLNKNAFVKIDLQTSHGPVTIERGIEPGLFNLTVNGNRIDKAGKKSVQDYFEEEILEMPFYIFTNTLSLSIDDFKSFLKMNNFDKKAIIDRIFGLQILNDMREILKQQTKKLKESLEEIRISVEVQKQSMDASKRELDDLERRINEETSDKLVKLQELLVLYNSNFEKAANNHGKLQQKLSELQTLKNGFRKSMQGDEELSRECWKKIELYQNSKCPTCETDLQTDFHQHIKSEYDTKLSEASGRITEKTSQITKVDESLRKVQEMKQKNEDSYRELQYKINTAQSQINECERDKGIDQQTFSLKKLVADSVLKIQESSSEESKITKAVNYFGLVEEILGEKGVKQMAIKSILPGLNSEIGKLLKTLGIEHRIVFNEEFDARITHFGIEISAETLSSGESVKVDVAILLAVIKLMKIKYPQINMMFLDELFANLDGNSQLRVTNLLKDITRKLDLKIFVVNHYPLSLSEFDYSIEVNKLNGFSNFVMQKVE